MADSRPARAELKQWISGPGRTQALLAAAVGVTQQTISAVLGGRTPSPDLAELIEAATGIHRDGWATARERERRERRLLRARGLMAAGSVEHPTPVRRRRPSGNPARPVSQHGPDVGDSTKRAG